MQEARYAPVVMLSKCLLLVLFLGLLSLAAAALTHDGLEPERGWEQSEVLRYWGPPHEKIEYESKREEAWRYKQHQVLFREGLLVEGSKTAAAKVRQSQESPPPAPARRTGRSNRTLNSAAEVQEFFAEIQQAPPVPAQPSSDMAPRLTPQLTPRIPPQLPTD